MKWQECTLFHLQRDLTTTLLGIRIMIMQSSKRSRTWGLGMGLLFTICMSMMPGHAFAAIITATATGSPTPPTKPGPLGTTVINGDFLITRTGINSTVG